jgi:putative adhesin
MLRRIAIFGSLVLVAAAGLEAKTKEFHQTVPLDLTGRVTVETHNGSVTVNAWGRASVQIDARIEADGALWQDVERTKIRVTPSSRDVRIETDYSAIGIRWLNFTDRPIVRYTISMPATARLVIDSHNAAIKVSGLRSDVRVNSHNGPVDVRGLDGAAEIETHNGRVQVDFARFNRSSRIETHNGAVEISMPAESRLTLRASGHRYNPVDSDFAMVMHGRGGSYSATINGGGPELRFDTHNGSLRLRKL